MLALLAGIAPSFGSGAMLKERETIAQRERAEQQRQATLALQLTAQASLLADRGFDEVAIERAAALATGSWRRMHNVEAVDIADRLSRLLPSARIEHGGTVRAVAFSLDSRWLATRSGNTARLIETATSKEVARIVHRAGLNAIAFSPDGRLLAMASEDSTVRLVWADPQHVFDLLCAKAGRNLSPDEWRTYIGADEPWRPTCPNWRNAEAPAQDR